MTNLYELYEQNGFKLEIDGPIAKCTRESKRARLGYTVKFHYRFSTKDRLIKYVTWFIEDKIRAKEIRAKRKEERKIREKKEAEHVKVGDIFVDSWGYEQTNVQMYQVVDKPTASTVVVREIGTQIVEGSEMPHGMACHVVAVPNAFVGGPMKKRLVGSQFKTRSFSHARKTDVEKMHYKSWYA